MASDPTKSHTEADFLPKKTIDVADVESTCNGEGGVVADTARVQDHAAEVSLCRKFDIRILPVLAVMCECPVQTSGC